MKLLYLILLFLLPIISFSQKYILIDKELQKTSFLADTATLKELNAGYIVFAKNDVDSLLLNLKIIKTYFTSKERKRNRKILIKFGQTAIIGERQHYSYGERFDINMYSFIGDLSGKLILSNSRLSNLMNQKRVEKIIRLFSSTPRALNS